MYDRKTPIRILIEVAIFVLISGLSELLFQVFQDECIYIYIYKIKMYGRKSRSLIRR